MKRFIFSILLLYFFSVNFSYCKIFIVPSNDDFEIAVCSDADIKSWQIFNEWNKKIHLFNIVNDGLDNFDVTFNKPNTEFIFTGDAMGGLDSIKILNLFVYLKNKYPNRIHLVLGNQEINKLRLLLELSNEVLTCNNKNQFSLDQRVEEWKDDFKRWRKSYKNIIDNDRLLKFKWIFSTFINPDAFENFKKEIDVPTEKEACEYYMSLFASEKLFSTYFSLLQSIYYNEKAGILCQHGTVNQLNFGSVIGEQSYAMPIETMEDLKVYAEVQNEAVAQIIKNVLNGNPIEALQLIKSQEQKVIEQSGKTSWSKASYPGSFLRRERDEKGDLIPMPSEFEAQLSRFVNIIFYGHIPPKDGPILVKSRKPGKHSEDENKKHEIVLNRGTLFIIPEAAMPAHKATDTLFEIFTR